MPEGPELHLASRFIEKVCNGRIFSKVCKSEISKNPPVTPPFSKFHIGACSRGKEVKLILTDASENADKAERSTVSFEILFTFGLAGKFDFCAPDEMQKHSHLSFYTEDNGPQMVLSFVDYMRFGKWTPNTSWSKDRGPCVLFEYPQFRSNVLLNLETNAFKKPICEALLNQKYFNGIGNYLRAEVLYRHGTPPFVSARSALEPLLGAVKSETPDILDLCHTLAMEVVNLEGDGYDLQDRADESKAFNQWLQCYYQTGMKNMADHNGRTIWFHGPAGPMAPKDVKVRARKSDKKKKKDAENEAEEEKTNKAESDTGEVIGGKRKRTRNQKNGDKPSRKTTELGEEKKTARKRKNLKRKKVAKGSNLELELTEPSKKVSRRQELIINNQNAIEETPLSISDLQLIVAVENKCLTRGKVKSMLQRAENAPKTPAARTKTTARIASYNHNNTTPQKKNENLRGRKNVKER